MLVGTRRRDACTRSHIYPKRRTERLVVYAALRIMSVATRYLEFDGVTLDLRHVAFSRSQDELNNTDYIIFFNVKRALFRNFNLVSDLSLETLAMFVYENVRCTIGGRVCQRDTAAARRFEQFIFNENDRNKSIIIELHDDARLIVAAAIKPHEKYHQRVGGYMDFEKRHSPADERDLTEAERAERDRLYEIKLFEFT
uniref:Ac57 n=1 Tax=Lymantria dispar multicapsid nuclear polyhedrosis virus TaxID=10449 RepID=A0A1B1MQS5_NPVLD|nr:hypothetical protein [Lymantria dispar multiple nucleopolyhedrovirus]